MSYKLRLCTEHISREISAGGLVPAFKSFEEDLCEGTVRGLDVDQFSSLSEWVSWLKWSSVVLDENDYLKAAVQALRLAPKMAGTDYGTSRQRDLGQLWADTIRGFLGEIAFAKWLKERFGISAELDYRRGPLEEFLPSDIKSVNGRPPRLKISVKTTKFGGVWLDVPGAQIKHSDVYVLVRVGITRDHLLAFFKKISVFRDKFFKEALERGIAGKDELEEIWGSLPEFAHVPAYVAGFLDKAEIADFLNDEKSIILADGEVKIKKVIINKFLGYWHPAVPDYERKVREKLKSQGKSIRDDMKIEFVGIQNFSKELHFLASSGVLKRKQEEWEKVITKL